MSRAGDQRGSSREAAQRYSLQHHHGHAKSGSTHCYRTSRIYVSPSFHGMPILQTVNNNGGRCKSGINTDVHHIDLDLIRSVFRIVVKSATLPRRSTEAEG